MFRSAPPPDSQADSISDRLLVAVLLSKNCAESRTYGMSVAARQTSPPEKSFSPSRRLLSKPKLDMDWIGSMGAGPPCSFNCFDITSPPLWFKAYLCRK